MKKCSKALKLRALKLTDDIYKEVVCETLEIDTNLPDIKSIVNDFSRESRLAHLLDFLPQEEQADLLRKRELVADLYIKRILQLPTKSLIDIIDAHERPGGIRRASKTVQAILDELTRRTIFGDTNESDIKDAHGDVCEPAKSSKRCSKKATKKRGKAIKNRWRNRVV